MSGSGTSERHKAWATLQSVELSGTVVDILRNGDVIVRSDVPIAHPKLENNASVLYGGVPKLQFAEGDRVAFRVRWRETSGQHPALIDPNTLRTLGPDDPQPDLTKAREAVELAGDLEGLRAERDQLQAAIEKLRTDISSERALAATRLTEIERETEQAKAAVDEHARASSEAIARERADVARDRARLQAELQEIERSGLHRLLEAQDHDSPVRPRQAAGLPVPDDPVSRLHDALTAAALSYPIEVVRRAFLAHVLAASLGQIIVYAGPPGSGKSSLAIALPQVLDIEAQAVAVRPGWLDASDALGFFDPRDNRFVSAPFLDLLLAARESEPAGLLHTIVLDEMNIARIENYGADLLSQLEKAHELGGGGTIHLYSSQIQRELDRKALAIATQGGDARLAVIPAAVSIPTNLILAGTLNHDESTEHLSPKVLDRSIVVRVPPHTPHPSAMWGGSPSVAFSLDAELVLAVRATSADFATEANALWKRASELVAGLDIPRVHLSHRLARCFQIAPGIGRSFDIDASDLLDDLISTKLLPWVSFFPSRQPEALQNLEELGGRAAADGLTGLATEIRTLLDLDDDLVEYLR